MYTYEDIKNFVTDKLRDAKFNSTREEETLRAINSAIDDINSGETGEDRGAELEVAYEFQREDVDVSFVNGTESYTFASLAIDEPTFKFSDELIVKTDENVQFTETTEKYFRRKAGVYSSNENMFAIATLNGAKTLKINYDTTDTLTYTYFTSNTVLNADGTTRQAHFTDGGTTEQILIPDRHVMTLVHLSVAELYKQLYGFTLANNIPEFQYHLKEGRNRMKRMIQSIGKIQKRPTERMMIRSEWASPISRVLNN